MNKIKLFSLNEQKSKIGFAHGFACIIGAIILGYLTMMIFSKLMPGDYGIKIIPAIIFTPILICFYGLWLLFSKTIMSSILKVLITAIIFILILKVF